MNPPSISRVPEIRSTVIILFFHTFLLSAGFLILVQSFDFPDILRETSPIRLASFLELQHITVPAYYLMALTGITQVVLAVLFFTLLKESRDTLNLFALTFGVICGVAQFAGYIRWSIVIPYLAQVITTHPEQAGVITLIENTLNRYGGMAIGEHLGFLGQGAWTLFVGLAMLKNRLFGPLYGWLGIFLGSAFLLSSLEQLGGPFSVLGMITAPISGAWIGWVFAMAINLLRSDPHSLQGPGGDSRALIVTSIAMIAFTGFALG